MLFLFPSHDRGFIIFHELPEEIQQKIIKQERDNRVNDGEIPWQHETLDSLKKLFEKTNGAKLKDYSLGLWGYSYLKVDLDECTANLTGARALGWLENNLLCNLRITRADYLKHRKSYLKYGFKIGKIPECPLTGYCADMDYLEDLIKAIKKGSSLEEAFEGLSDTYVKLLKSEYENYLSENEIKESLCSYGNEYTSEGKEI